MHHRDLTLSDRVRRIFKITFLPNKKHPAIPVQVFHAFEQST